MLNVPCPFCENLPPKKQVVPPKHGKSECAYLKRQSENLRFAERQNGFSGSRWVLREK
jgi:hypothetical protein